MQVREIILFVVAIVGVAMSIYLAKRNQNTMKNLRFKEIDDKQIIIIKRGGKQQ